MSDTPETISVTIEAVGWAEALADCAEIARAAARGALQTACPGAAAGEIAVLLTDDAALRQLNAAWRGLDKPTNVLSFPATDVRPGEIPQPDFPGVPLTLGDIALAFETMAAEAEAAQRPLAHHLRHLTVHGVLHLLGWDHIEEVDAERMERLEIAILAAQGVPDPYLAPDSRNLAEEPA